MVPETTPCLEKVSIATKKKKKILTKSVKKVKSTLGSLRFKKLSISRPDVLHSYLSHDEINQYLEYLARRYSTFVKVHTIGLSYERRILKAIEIDWCCPTNMLFQAQETARRVRKYSAITPEIVKMTERTRTTGEDDKQPESPRNNRNYVFIEGGTHAREWISITTALHCAYQLTEKSTRHVELLRKMRFFILPLSNPDGYEYSRTKNRRWRKNRRPLQNSKQVGTDCNRNYDFQWDSGGATKLNRNTYKGEKPFSEPETRAIRKILQNLAPQLLFFLSLHSYAQSIMYPWGYSRELPAAWAALQTVATSGRSAIKRYTGRLYRTGSIANLSKHNVPGSIVDYVFGVIKVPFALVMELPSLKLGFQPPPEVISPVGHESWCGISEMCKCAYGLHSLIEDGKEVEKEQVQPELFAAKQTQPNVEVRVAPQSAPAAIGKVKPPAAINDMTLKKAHHQLNVKN